MNPLLELTEKKLSHIPFDQIKPEHFLPALEQEISKAKANLSRIEKDGSTPTFENTIEALEFAAEGLSLVSNTYYVLFSAESPAELTLLAEQISPKLAEFDNDVFLSDSLFGKVKYVYENLFKSQSGEQARLTEITYKNFVRNGALLDSNAKEQLRSIDKELSSLGPKFAEQVLQATNAFLLHVENQEDVAGIPEGALEAAATLAKSKNLSGWAFTLQGPSYIPFISYADKRELREKMYRGFRSKCFNDAFDNQELIKQIADLRKKRAILLGFKSHAAYVLEERMAENGRNVNQFLDELLNASKPAALEELKELQQYANNHYGFEDVQAWDVKYLSEKVKIEKYDFDEEALRPFFSLEKVMAGLFDVAKRLYGLSFKERLDIPTYHKEVKVFEASDDRIGYVGLLYVDLFPRDTKKGGAWMTDIIKQGSLHGKQVRPDIGIVCNFTKPTETKPSLLSYDEVKTLFHEFGHALHGLLSECKYNSLSGTSVYWDFVELPSQIMENWVDEKDVLDIFASHFETGEKISKEMIEKLQRSRTFMAGMNTMTQLSYGLLDMAFHDESFDLGKVKTVREWELNATKETQILPIVDNTSTACSFAHIFAGGYSAGYYSYKWAEVLDADAFESFKEKGIFDKETANAFRLYILARGNSEPPMDLYMKFRGRKPDPKALLRRDGLIAA